MICEVPPSRVWRTSWWKIWEKQEVTLQQHYCDESPQPFWRLRREGGNVNSHVFVIIQFCHYPALLKLSKEAIVQLAWEKHRLQWRLQTKCDIFAVKLEYFLTHRHAMWFLYFSSAHLAIKQCQCFRFSFRDCEHEEYVSMKQI